MFSDCDWVIYMRNLLRKKNSENPNAFHNHLNWALECGENLAFTKKCPQCGEQPVRYFSVRGSYQGNYSMSSAFTCCDNPNCISKLKTQGLEKTPVLYELKFSATTHFHLKADKRQITRIIRDCLELPARATKQKIFEALKG